jgi:UDP-N-acetylmuramyl pentapeptide phosphotransferase/UDP-N-acetylglucosamine-1-phosphate transferase
MLGINSQILGPLLCLAVVTASLPVVVQLLRRAAIVDEPGVRSSHTISTPRGGGIAVILGVVFGIAIMPHGVWFSLTSAMLAFGAIGLLDDLRGLSVRLRLVLQMGASALVGALLVLNTSTVGLPIVAGAVTAIWLIGFVNVFNFMDGINGISGAHAVLGGIVFAILGIWIGDSSLPVAGATVAAGGLAFLPWNAVNAKVFLGDVGSYGLGAALAVLAAYAVLLGAPVEAVLAPLALYLADTAWTLQRRIRAREEWMQPHRTHVYQRLCDRGWSHQRVALVTIGFGSLLSGLGAASLSGQWQLRLLADIVAVAVLAAYLAAPRWSAASLRSAESS